MPKRRAPKKINREIMKAIQFLTNQNLYVTVKLADIVDRVKYQIKETHFNQNVDKMIKEAVYKLRDFGLIDHVGYNQYCCADCFVSDEVEDQPEVQPAKPESRYFVPYPRRSMLENSSSLDPNRRKRQPENESSCSLSGNEIERTRKRFYGKKIVKKDERNPPLPGARQVPDRKEESETNSGEESAHTIVGCEVQIQEIPACSWTQYNALVPRRCCNIIQLSKSDDELIRATELFDTEEESDVLEVHDVVRTVTKSACNVETLDEMENQANNVVDVIVEQKKVEKNEDANEKQ